MMEEIWVISIKVSLDVRSSIVMDAMMVLLMTVNEKGNEDSIKNVLLLIILKLTKLSIVIFLNRFPFILTRQLGSGGFACVYEGQFHGEQRALKFIPLRKDQIKYNIKSYGCHEYYQQET